jgi:hypothetical protein
MAPVVDATPAADATPTVDTAIVIPQDSAPQPIVDATIDSAQAQFDSFVPVPDSTNDVMVVATDATADTMQGTDATVDSSPANDAEPKVDGSILLHDASSDDGSGTGGTGGAGGTGGTGGTGEGGCEGCTISENGAPDASMLLWGVLLLGWFARRRK